MPVAAIVPILLAGAYRHYGGAMAVLSNAELPSVFYYMLRDVPISLEASSGRAYVRNI